jgi:hypothetical protein
MAQVSLVGVSEAAVVNDHLLVSAGTIPEI